MTQPVTDAFLRDLFARTRSFACVGVSANPVRPSHYVARYLTLKGYRVVSVNPAYGGTELFGSTVQSDLASIEEPIDILDIFRRPEAVPAIVEEGFRVLKGLKCVWLQIGIVSAEAEALCAEADVPLVQNRCPKMEYQRLFGDLRKGGFATGIISSRLQRKHAP